MDAIRRKAATALGGRRWLLLCVAAAALASVGAQAALSADGSPVVFAAGDPARAPVGRWAAASAHPLVQRRAAHPDPARHYLVARATRPVRMRSRPRGPVDAILDSRTEFGSPRVLSVARRHGPWLGVVTSARPNGRLGWVNRHSPGLRLRRTAYSLRADLSRRTLALRRGRRVIIRMAVGVGAPHAPTPTGRFAVTDKLHGSAFGRAYGCCVIAFSGFQTHPPPGWTGGNRLAVHGTRSGRGVGSATSAGCLQAGTHGLRVLMRRVPLGTPVFIRR